MNIEILRNNNTFYLNVTEWLQASPGGTEFSNPIKEMSKKKELNVFSEEVLHVCGKERWHDVSLQKLINEIHLRVVIDRFLRSLLLNKPFSVISDPTCWGK